MLGDCVSCNHPIGHHALVKPFGRLAPGEVPEPPTRKRCGNRGCPCLEYEDSERPKSQGLNPRLLRFKRGGSDADGGDV